MAGQRGKPGLGGPDDALSPFDTVAECEQRKAQQDWAGHPQYRLKEPAHAFSLTWSSVRDSVARKAYSRLVA